jgi:predicted nucleotide-binding protein (sugar kinase/HSP70/actin superfamily)
MIVASRFKTPEHFTDVFAKMCYKWKSALKYAVRLQIFNDFANIVEEIKRGFTQINLTCRKHDIRTFLGDVFVKYSPIQSL